MAQHEDCLVPHHDMENILTRALITLTYAHELLTELFAL
jgi:hypothetical protein